MILNDPEPCTVMYFQSSSPPPHKKKVLSTILNDTLEEEEKIINYGHRINELKHKIKICFISTQQFFTVVSNKKF